MKQISALDNKLKIHVGYTPTSPISIDTEEDLKSIQDLMKI